MRGGRSRLLALVMVCLLLPMVALAQGGGAVQDSAAVLSSDTLRDLRTLSERTENRADITLAVETRHFLGGADVQSYARRLLGELGDPDHSLLLLLVIGEESYALAAGSQVDRLLNAQVKETLLSTRFRPDYLARRYDQAVADLFTGAAERIASASGESIRTDDLFGRQAPPPATPAPSAAPTPRPTYKVIDLTGPNSVLGERAQPQRTPRPQYDREGETRGLSIGSIILIGLVLSMVFGKKGKGRGGSGCGPLGWIFGVFGLSKFFGWRR